MTIPTEFSENIADRMNYRAGFNDAAIFRVAYAAGYNTSDEPMPVAYTAGYEAGKNYAA